MMFISWTFCDQLQAQTWHIPAKHPRQTKTTRYTIETDTNSITSMRSSRESWAIQLRRSHRLGRKDYLKAALNASSTFCGTFKCDLFGYFSHFSSFTIFPQHTFLPLQWYNLSAGNTLTGRNLQCTYLLATDHKGCFLWRHNTQEHRA